MSEHFFAVYQDGLQVASGYAPTWQDAIREAGHYGFMYEQDGPISVEVRPAKEGEVEEWEEWE